MGQKLLVNIGGGGGGGQIPLFEGQLKQNFIVCKYVTNSIQNDNKIDDVVTASL